MTSTIDLTSPKVRVAGSPLTRDYLDKLISLRVQLGQCVVGRATLRFSDLGFAVSASSTFAIGTEVKITAGSSTLLNGTVTGVNLEQRSTNPPELLVIVDDGGYKLARGAKPVTYKNVTFTSVIEQLATNVGLTSHVTPTDGLSQTVDYLLQTGSALALIDRLTQRTGAVWRIEDKQLVVEPAGTAHGSVNVTLGEDLVEFSVRASGLYPTKVNVSGWDVRQQQPIVGTAQPSRTAPADFVSGYVASSRSGSLSEDEVSLAGFMPSSQQDATAIAEALGGLDVDGAVVARGTCHVQPTIKPGTTVQVTDAGPASGHYVTSEVEHVYTDRGFQTRFVAGPRRPTGLVDTLGRAAPDPGLRVTGLVVGVVTDNKDPDEYGRVKVKYPGLNGEVESDWARVVSLGAGPSRGAVFQPEVNDEVLVGFEFGDSRRAVVIGGLYSPNNALPEAQKVLGDGTVDYRRITSRKKHVVELADGTDSATQHVLLQLGTAEHKLRLGADAFLIEMASGKPLTIKAGDSKFEITNSGDINIEAANISIKATAKLALEGATVEIKGQSQAELQAAIVSVKANGTASIDGGGALTLKGGMVQIN